VKDELQWMVRKLSSGITGPKTRTTFAGIIGSEELQRGEKEASRVDDFILGFAVNFTLYKGYRYRDAFGMI
jgi:hypothetical protein